MKQLPRKAAENASLLGAWKQPATSASIPVKNRRAWHKARREGRTGEQMDRAFESRYTVQDSRNAAARMKASL